MLHVFAQRSTVVLTCLLAGCSSAPPVEPANGGSLGAPGGAGATSAPAAVVASGGTAGSPSLAGSGGAVSPSGGMSAGSAGTAGATEVPPVLNAAPTKTFVVVTAGQSNAGLRIDDGGLATGSGWDHPLVTRQNRLIAQTLGALDVKDSGDRYGGDLNTAVGGCGLMKSMDGCYFVDDTTSADPSGWKLASWGLNLAANLNASKQQGEVVFVSWIQGEANAHSLNAEPSSLPGHSSQGGPYAFTSRGEWADHYKEVLKRLAVLLADAANLPDLRMAIQLIAAYDGDPDLIRKAQLEAIAESQGQLLLGNGNPWQWYAPISDSDGAHYSGQAYMDLSLETGRSIAFALRTGGVVDSQPGPGYGQFPAIMATVASGNSVDVAVSNPNQASTLLLPEQDATRGWSVLDGGNDVPVVAVALAAPFTIRLTLAQVVGATAHVRYGTEGNHPRAGGAVTDDAATASPADPNAAERRNMPLAVKPE